MEINKNKCRVEMKKRKFEFYSFFTFWLVIYHLVSKLYVSDNNDTIIALSNGVFS